MDQLETLIHPTETVAYGEQRFQVRGLGLAHITHIVREHRATCANLYSEAIAGRLKGSVEEVAFSMLDDFVPLAALVIACGCGNPKSAHIAAELPLSVQVEALEKIFALTLIAHGGLGKLVEVVIRAMGTAKQLIPQKP
ncbi:phage pre-tape measure protein [Rhizobium wenxiniae]|uniref:phage pre-tape measure protein n=1 Tax=Rhizobium wenxiniae TaxID=1737357 RepID=UPI003C28EF99